MTAEERPGAGATLVDAHVHVHERFGDTALTAAAENFSLTAKALDLPHPVVGVLALTTASHGDLDLARLRGKAEAARSWAFRSTAEGLSLVACRGQDRLVLIAGRQVATAEDLEVLALGCAGDLPEGLPMEATLGAVHAAGALPVVPWGFGKWWGRRGRLMRSLLQRQDRCEFFLGDNGGRPRVGPAPALFAEARRLGIRVLPGSDPLPLRGEARRAGSYGFVLGGALEADRPWASLAATLREPGFEPRPYGRRQRLLPFLRRQLAMQVRKRTGGRRL